MKGFTKETAASAGSKSKRGEDRLTREIKDKIALVINDNLEELNKDLKEMTKLEKWNILTKIASYAIPKQQSTEITADFQTTKADLEAIFPKIEDLEDLNNIQLDNIIDNIKIISNE